MLGRQFQGHPLASPGAVPVAAAGRRRFAAENSRPVSHDLSTVVVPGSRTEAIARMYDRLPSYDPAAVPHFRQFGHETEQQFDYMTRPRRRGGMGIQVETTKEDPYAGPKEMFQDLQENNRVKVFGTGTEESGQHPYLSNEQNDMFRAIHDVFGHAGAGRGFDRHGEEAAYVAHSQMFSPMARPAMATETRGQNSWFINRGGTQFPEQKVALLPPGMRAAVPMMGRRGERRAANLQAQQFNREQFGTP